MTKVTDLRRHSNGLPRGFLKCIALLRTASSNQHYTRGRTIVDTLDYEYVPIWVRLEEKASIESCTMPKYVTTSVKYGFSRNINMMSTFLTMYIQYNII